MKKRNLFSALTALCLGVLGQAEQHKVDFFQPEMDGWKSTPTTKTISYSKKRYISGGGGGISGGGGGGKWVTDWQKNKTVTSSVFKSISSDIARMNTIKPFATRTTTHVSDWNLETTFTSPRLDLTLDDNDGLSFEYRHKAGIEVKLGYSTDDGKKWKTLNNTKLNESAFFKVKKVKLENITQTNEFRIQIVVTDKAGRVIGNPGDFLEIKNLNTPPYYDPDIKKSLHLAAFEGDVKLAKRLLSKGRDANELLLGHSALHVAAFHGSIDVAAELVKNGADVNIQLDPKAINDVEIKKYTVKEGDTFTSIAKDHHLMHPKSGAVQFLRLNEIWLKGTALKNNPPTFEVGEVVKVIDANAGPEWFRHTRALKGQDNKLENPLGFSQVLGRVPALTPLELACVSEKTEMVSWLIKNGANPDGAPRIHNGLWTALGNQNETLLRVLLEGGADVNIERGKGDTPFRVVCTRGLPYFAKILIEAGANYNFKEKSLGKTSLRAAAHFGRTEMVQLLLDLGLDPDVRDDWGWTPLHVAINPETAKALIDGGANIHAKAKDGNEAIHSLIGENMLDSVKYLLSLGVDVDTHGKNNITPLHQAVIFNHLDGAKMLLENGANIKAADNKGMTCLHFARSEAMVKFLITNEAVVNSLSTDKTTPLHYAQNREIASLLINHEASLNVRDADGSTPLHWAASSRLNVANALIIAGAHLNIKDSSGLTPLDYANDESRVLLSKKGAKSGSQLVKLEYNLANRELVIHGVVGVAYAVEYSADLQNWKKAASLTMESARTVYRDNFVNNSAKRFFRLRSSN
ncbi:ankyrin repeat domain-containing protein [bacterium]|nr:ankyrin repeat domain-containing protein [bacterium]